MGAKLLPAAVFLLKEVITCYICAANEGKNCALEARRYISRLAGQEMGRICQKMIKSNELGSQDLVVLSLSKD